MVHDKKLGICNKKESLALWVEDWMTFNNYAPQQFYIMYICEQLTQTYISNYLKVEMFSTCLLRVDDIMLLLPLFHLF